MKVCRVLGPVVATVKHPSFAERALFVVQPLDEEGQDAEGSFLAVDAAQAGPGDVVLVMREGEVSAELCVQDTDAEEIMGHAVPV